MNHRDMIADMLEFLRKVQEFTVDGRVAFDENEMIQFAVSWAYQTVGEIAKRFPESFRTAHPEINWRRLIGFRDFLAHNYERIEVGPLWAAVEDLPNLIPALQSLHDSLPRDPHDSP